MNLQPDQGPRHEPEPSPELDYTQQLMLIQHPLIKELNKRLMWKREDGQPMTDDQAAIRYSDRERGLSIKFRELFGEETISDDPERQDRVDARREVIQLLKGVTKESALEDGNRETAQLVAKIIALLLSE